MKDEVRFSIRNLNREKIFKEIVKIAEIKNVEYNEETINFSVRKKYAKKVEKILEKKYVKIHNKISKGLFNLLKKTIFRVGIIIPIILFNIFIFISDNFVFRLEIKGLERIKSEEIYQILNNNNISGIIPKSKINTQNLENNLQKINEVSLVSVIIKGNTLIVNIKEKVYNAEFEDKDTFSPILSEHNGIITEITIIQGTPLVHVGQTIKKGQELVAPFVIDTSGNKLSVNPLAEIKADVFYTTYETIANKQVVFEDTGNAINTKQIFFKDSLLFSEGEDCTFKFYRTEVVSQNLSNKNCLPLKVVYTKFVEQKEVVINNFFETNKEEILESIKEKTRQLVEEYDIIKNEYNSITESGGVFMISHTIVVSKII